MNLVGNAVRQLTGLRREAYVKVNLAGQSLTNSLQFTNSDIFLYNPRTHTAVIVTLH